MITDPVSWVALERPDGTWDVVEDATSTVYQVSSALGTRLWQQDELWPIPLHQALDTASGQAPSSGTEEAPFVDLALAGAIVRYHAADPAVLKQLRTGLGAAVPDRRRTADVLVRLGSEARADMLHRSFAGDRPGVDYRMPGDPRWHALTGDLPALPPLATPPYSDRFIALHAALLVLPSSQGLLVCGNQKAGKTTAALWARDIGLASIATDEVVLLDSLTGVVFGVPLAVAVRSGDQRTAVPLPPGSTTYRGAALPAAVVILVPAEPLSLSGSVETAESEEEAMSWLAEHLRDGGASPASMHRSSRGLVSRIPVHRLGVSPWPGLIADFESGLSSVLKTLERRP